MLTKSDFVKFLQCFKLLWLYKNRKDLLPTEVDLSTEKVFEEGFVVEKYAYQLFPTGENAGDDDIKKSIANTKALLKKGVAAIFQPTFSNYDAGTFCRADIIVNIGENIFDIYEVKSSTTVKDIQIADVAFQKICLESAGLKIGRLHIIVVNNEYVRHGDIEPKKLLKIEDVTERAEKLMEKMGEQIKDALKVLDSKSEPQIRLGKQCHDPYDCPFVHYCWKDVPRPSVHDAGLSELNLKTLQDRGVIRLEDVPEEMITRPKKLWLWQTLRSGVVHIDMNKISLWLGRLKYPIYHLDYETYSSAVPMFDGYRPYQQIPFQYSLHVQESANAEVKHFEYLATTAEDPVPALANLLKSQIAPNGTVLAWNMSFEKGRNREMSEHVPEYAAFFADVNERMLDLMEPFDKGYFVDKDFGGSASLKSVLPTIAPELSYSDLEIQQGGDASSSWALLVGERLTAQEKKKLKANLLAYCERDTFAMVKILEKLGEVTGSAKADNPFRRNT